MKYALLLVAAILPLGALAAQESQSPGAQSRQAHVITPERLTWGSAPAILPAGARLAVLEGDPSKTGPFTMRLEMPAGYRIPPHFHAVDERVTVISGAFQVGMGDTFDEGKLTTLPPGTFGVDSARHAALRPCRQGYGHPVARHGTLGANLRQSSRSTEHREQVRAREAGLDQVRSQFGDPHLNRRHAATYTRRHVSYLSLRSHR